METINVGSNTAPETFHFAKNLWYAIVDPRISNPKLPVEEEDGIYGVDPELIDPENGDFHLKHGSPAIGKGAFSMPHDVI
ncbi:MAG: hypothetical protein ACUVTL_02240 [Thermoproteota archaeon]